MAIIFYLLDNDKQPSKNIVYLNQILNGSNLQDSATVVGLLEVGIRAIIKELHFIKDAVLILDNASCYQNHLVTFVVGIFNQKFHNGLFILAI